jgi:hypothetical protein
MFIERSAGRIRMARTLFVLAGLVPFVALVAWGVHLRSAAHRDALRGRWQQALGLPLAIDSVEHPRPGVVRARGVGVAGAGGRPLFEVPSAEVEAAAAEDRLRLDVVRIDAAAAAALGDVAREWLCREARHPRNCIVEVADFDWAGATRADEPPRRGAALRIECVAQDASRAIRVVRRGDGGEDVVRIVRTVRTTDGQPTVDFEVEVECREPVSVAVVAALAGAARETAAVMGQAAMARGRIDARRDGDHWSGTARGRVDGVDLGSCVRALQASASGEASIEIDRLSWDGGRVGDAIVECVVGPGWVDTPVFERLVTALGCRPGPAALREAGRPTRAFDAAGCLLRLGEGRVEITAPRRDAVALASIDGATLLEPPAAAVSFDRIAWMLSPPAATFVPATGPGAWLMSVLPDGGSARADAGKPSSGGGRREF